MEKGRNVRGFTLVEVVLAIGLATFALLVMFSLLPVGLNTLQDSNRQIMETEIFNTVGAELNSTNYSKLDDYVKSSSATTRFPLYYDLEGLKVASASGAVFYVRGRIYDAPTDREVRRVIVFIGYRKDPSKTPGQDPDPSDKDPSIKIRAFLIPNRGI